MDKGIFDFAIIPHMQVVFAKVVSSNDFRYVSPRTAGTTEKLQANVDREHFAYTMRIAKANFYEDLETTLCYIPKVALTLL